jgi:hypothetical protein
MGYQNGSRPETKELLVYDVYADLQDLKKEIQVRHPGDQDLVLAVDFMLQTLRLRVAKGG